MFSEGSNFGCGVICPFPGCHYLNDVEKDMTKDDPQLCQSCGFPLVLEVWKTANPDYEAVDDMVLHQLECKDIHDYEADEMNTSTAEEKDTQKTMKQVLEMELTEVTPIKHDEARGDGPSSHCLRTRAYELGLRFVRRQLKLDDDYLRLDEDPADYLKDEEHEKEMDAKEAKDHPAN